MELIINYIQKRLWDTHNCRTLIMCHVMVSGYVIIVHSVCCKTKQAADMHICYMSYQMLVCIYFFNSVVHIETLMVSDAG